MSKQSTSKPVIPCEWCKKPTLKRVPTTRFCSKRCMQIHRWRTTDIGDRVRQAHKGKPNPGAAEYMKANNPMHQKSVVQKMVETKRRNGTLGLLSLHRGGNGKLTRPQRLLLDLLGPKWKAELPIKTKLTSPYPPCYKVDIGRRRYKVAVEIDGKNHINPKNRKKDRKKQRVLESLGWKVLRFTNEEVLSHPRRVLKTIRSSTA